MEAKHTPGPWHAGSGGLANRIVFDATGWAIADARVYHGRIDQEGAEKNARLIAAAPDLLEALREIVENAAFANNAIAHGVTAKPGQGHTKVATALHHIERIARAAIAKATTTNPEQEQPK